MKVNISMDEEYPVYGITKRPDGNGIEVPDDLFQRYSSNLAEFDAIQAEIAKIYAASVKARDAP